MPDQPSYIEVDAQLLVFRAMAGGMHNCLNEGGECGRIGVMETPSHIEGFGEIAYPTPTEIEVTNKIAEELFGTEEDETQAKPTFETALKLISVEKNNFVCLKNVTKLLHGRSFCRHRKST